MAESSLSESEFKNLLWRGRRIIESEWLTEPGDPMTVKRTWRERLFSWPWRPFKATRIHIPQVPMRGGYHLPDGYIAMHPATVRELRRVLNEDESV